MKEELIVGLVSISDRASAGVYRDEGIPSLQGMAAFADRLARLARRNAPHRRRDGDNRIDARRAGRRERCHLVLTTGGTGPPGRDVNARSHARHRRQSHAGFGEQMRSLSLKFVPTAILSRQVAVIRSSADHQSAGPAKSIRETPAGMPDAPESLPRLPYCIDLIGGPYIETTKPWSGFRRSRPSGKSRATPLYPSRLDEWPPLSISALWCAPRASGVCCSRGGFPGRDFPGACAPQDRQALGDSRVQPATTSFGVRPGRPDGVPDGI